jgi:hypothetical protein
MAIMTKERKLAVRQYLTPLPVGWWTVPRKFEYQITGSDRPTPEEFLEAAGVHIKKMVAWMDKKAWVITGICVFVKHTETVRHVTYPVAK